MTFVGWRVGGGVVMLLACACGSSGRQRDEPVPASGGSSGAGMGGAGASGSASGGASADEQTDAGRGGAGAGGGASAGGSDAVAAGAGGDSSDDGEAGAASTTWPLTGEYWIESPARHVRITSPTEARVSADFGAELTYAIETSPGAALETILVDGRPRVRGPIVLRNENEEFAISGDPADETATVNAVVRLYPCPNPLPPMWTTNVTSIRRDDDPTLVEVFGSVWIPWQPLQLASRKLAAEPLHSDMTVRSGDVDVAVTWTAGNVAGETSMLWATLTNGLDLIGQTITFAGSVRSTNGVPSPVGPFDVPVLDFGPARSGVIDFIAENPPELATFGNPLRVAAGDAICADGCLAITTTQGVALRLTNPGPTLRVEAIGGQLTVEAHAAGLEATTLTADFVSGPRDFPLPAGASEVFLTITAPYAAPMQTGCPVFGPQTSRLLTVTAGGDSAP